MCGMTQMNNPYTIYVLADPRDITVHYVGMSKNVPRRYKQHCHCQGLNLELNAWVQDLLRQGHTPVLHRIETVADVQSAQKRETYWIQFWESLNAPLKNIAKMERDGGMRITNPMIDALALDEIQGVTRE